MNLYRLRVNRIEMKKIDDYRWLGNRWEIQDYILNDRSWEEISRTRIVGGFVAQLVEVRLLNSQL